MRFDALSIACYLAEGIRAEPCVHAARVLFAAVRAGPRSMRCAPGSAPPAMILAAPRSSARSARFWAQAGPRRRAGHR